MMSLMNAGFLSGAGIGLLLGLISMSGIIVRCVYGIIAKRISAARGMKGGFCWGFFLGVVGIIVMRCCPKY